MENDEPVASAELGRSGGQGVLAIQYDAQKPILTSESSGPSMILALIIGLIAGFAALAFALYAGYGLLTALLFYAVAGALGILVGALAVAFRAAIFRRRQRGYIASEAKE